MEHNFIFKHYINPFKTSDIYVVYVSMAGATFMSFSMLSINSRPLFGVHNAMVYLIISSCHTPSNKHLYSNNVHVYNEIT